MIDIIPEKINMNSKYIKNIILAMIIAFLIYFFTDKHPLEESVIFSLRDDKAYLTELNKLKVFLFLTIFVVTFLTLQLLNLLIKKLGK